jgi:hypothetical protein
MGRIYLRESLDYWNDMEILPPRIQPFQRLITRTHDPKVASWKNGYRQYRPCLRWEFGFTCAFCMLREEDLTWPVMEGTGLTTIEHREPQSTSPTQANTYENCLYVCLWCNRARSNQPVTNAAGHRLLEPTSAVWSEHFVAEGDTLSYRQGDKSAEYTYRAYDLDDPRKVKLRAMRRDHLDYCLRLIREGPRQLRALQDRFKKAMTASSTGAESPSADDFALAELLKENIARAWRELQRYKAVPLDAEPSCRCTTVPIFQLPDALRVQVQEVPAPSEASQNPGTAPEHSRELDSPRKRLQKARKKR